MKLLDRLFKQDRGDRGIQVQNLGPIAQSISFFQSKLYTSPRVDINGVDPSHWPSALEPVRPLAPQGSVPLIWPYNIGQNLSYTPRADAEYSAAELKELSKYPLARVCIENIKDYLVKTPWAFQLKSQPGESNDQRTKRGIGDDNLLKLSRFFEYPDGEHDWSHWVRPLIEDELVIDAPAVLVMRTNAGVIAGLAWTRGDTITRYIDDAGMTPKPPSPAYSQVYFGLPRINLTTDQLIYRPRNIVPRNTIASNLYGFSVTEAIADEIKVGILRLRSVQAYYEKGNVPGVMIIAPSDVPAPKIKETMQLLASETAGQLDKLRQMRIVPGFKRADDPGQDQVVIIPSPILSDVFDEQHIRRICFGFGTSPQRMVKALNRAASEAAQSSAEEEGATVWMDWLSDYVNFAVQRVMGYEDYEFVMQPKEDTDPQKKAATHQVQIAGAQRSINDIRKEDGFDPDPAERANKLGFLTGTGFVTLDEMDDLIASVIQKNEQPPMMGGGGSGGSRGSGGSGGSGSGNGKPSGKPSGSKPSGSKPTPTSKLDGTSYDTEPKVKKARGAKTGALSAFRLRSSGRERSDASDDEGEGGSEVYQPQPATFTRTRTSPSRPSLDILGSRASRSLRLSVRNDRAGEAVLSKALKNPGWMRNTFRESVDRVRDELSDRIASSPTMSDAREAINNTDWSLVSSTIESHFRDAAIRGGLDALRETGRSNRKTRTTVFDDSVQYARDRADSLTNPEGEYSIRNTAQKELHALVDEASTPLELSARIKDAKAFSPARLDMTTDTEMSRARHEGMKSAYKLTGHQIEWVLDSAHKGEWKCECPQLAANGPYEPDDVPEIPAHPNCLCSLRAVLD